MHHVPCIVYGLCEHANSRHRNAFADFTIHRSHTKIEFSNGELIELNRNDCDQSCHVLQRIICIINYSLI